METNHSSKLPKQTTQQVCWQFFQQSNAYSPLELGLDWKYSKKVSFPPIQTSPPQQEKPRGLKRVDPPKLVEADSIPRGRKHIEQETKPEVPIEEHVGRRKKSTF
jgi:hypothetical protein